MASRINWKYLGLGLLICSVIGRAQQASVPQFGIVPTGTYQAYQVDAVNLRDFLDVINIPVFSLPQVGKLSLGFSAVSNTTNWQPDEFCSTDGYDCTYQYVAFSPTYAGTGQHQPDGVSIGPAIVSNNMPTVQWDRITPEECHDTGQSQNPDFRSTRATTISKTRWSVYNSTGGSSPLYYDSTNISRLRTTDGTGFLYLSGLADPSKVAINEGGAESGAPVLIDSRGIRSTFAANGAVSQADPDGNTINLNPDGSYTDTVGRIVPAIPQATSSTAGCPNLGADFQPAWSSSLWQVPGSNNGTSNYLICYARISYHVCLLSYGCDQNESFTWLDSHGDPHITRYQQTRGTETAIQSIVLPDGTFWGFIYDAANPADLASQGLATLTKLLLPQGGSISYGYKQNNSFCNAGGFPSIILASRTVDDANGNSYLWQYGSNGTSVIDPNLNATTYSFTSVPWLSPGACVPSMETSRKYYQGSSTLLRSIATTYTLTPEPVGSRNNVTTVGIGNALSHTITTQLADGLASTAATESYGGTFSAVMPDCQVTYIVADSKYECVTIPATPQVLSLAIPTSSSITDYSGVVINRTTTAFHWQSDQAYLNANVLDTPSITSIYDGSALPVMQAETKTFYDDTSYVTNAGVIAGHPTKVSRRNDDGSYSSVYTSWNANGMVERTVDAAGNPTARYSYNYTDYNSQFVHLYPDSITNALNQISRYSWDPNTGRQMSMKDVNDVQTTFTYEDQTGRISKIKNAVGTSEESWTTYSYPSPREVDMAQDQTSKMDQLLKATISVDGLGRVVRSVGVNGASQETVYDGLDRPVSLENKHFTSSSGTDGHTTFAYDGIGRPTLQCQPDHGTSGGPCADGASYLQWTYTGNITTYRDESGRTWQRTVDSLGHLLKVLEPTGLETNYVYSALGNLMSVVQAGLSQSGTAGSALAEMPRVRRFKYDSLSRLIKACNPEALPAGQT